MSGIIGRSRLSRRMSRLSLVMRSGSRVSRRRIGIRSVTGFYLLLLEQGFKSRVQLIQLRLNYGTYKLFEIRFLSNIIKSYFNHY